MIWLYLLPFTFLVLLHSNPVEAKIYSCEGPNGGTMLTDQPKGKRGCTVVKTPSPSPPGGFTPPVEEAPAAPPDLQPNTFLPSQPVSPIHQPNPRPLDPIDKLQPPTGSQAGGEKAAPEAQRCSPRVNPLNPFAGMNCSPTADETKKP
ncbi:MAG TPA: DUF4124 domain-containing protein [Nitrospira sp.]|nr:DUF4124 domain-containing protein [Nitrospira sp.]MCW5795991.1 DUF4124 domain-containing protein [Nitrospira sp.]HMU29786.1 DUF4124 domain-containing protein [Nitrospira sp.]HMV56391.1 DUF4124 domain-containing protein [Nitrospira sp.]HMW85731.1 DUF4124 domain-containing protein [Nitrospira sp.]